MKFLWLDINSSYSHSSLAFPALHSQLSTTLKNENEWDILTGTLKSNENLIIEKIYEAKPDYIFATCWLFNINYITTILKKVHSLLPHIEIFLGGPEFLGDNSEFLYSNRYVKSVFKGEGEEVFNDFIKSLSSKSEEWKNLNGYEYFDEDTYISKEAVYVKNFISLTPPSDSDFFNWSKPFVQLETSRGCFNKCKFCVSGIDKSDVQDLPVELLRERIDLIRSKGIREVRVLDRTFNANTGRAIELLKLFNEYWGDINFHIEIHPALLSPKFRDYLSSQLPDGLLHVEAGIQSLNDDVLSCCSRLGMASKSLEGLIFLKSLNKFEVHADLIVGLPKYSYNNLLNDTIELISTGVDEVQIELLKLLPGTYFRNNANKYDIRYAPIPPYEVLQTQDISFVELNKSMVLSKMIDRWYNNDIWRDIFVKFICSSDNLLSIIIDKLESIDFAVINYSLESLSLLLFKLINEYAPSLSDDFSIKWIKKGFSLKKDPALKLQAWRYGKSDIYNPIFIDNNSKIKYYYFDGFNKKYWFAFTNDSERATLVKELEIIKG